MADEAKVLVPEPSPTQEPVGFAQPRTLTAMAHGMGMTVSDVADAAPWDAEAIAAYAGRHGNRAAPIGHRHLPDVQIASAVRMLMRNDLDHESVVCAARDRICALHMEKAELLDALQLILPLAKGYSPEGQTDTAKATCRSWIEAAEEAIAKAEGRSNG